MISEKALKAIEYDKIMAEVSNFAVLESTKEYFRSFVPLTSLYEVDILIKKTAEAYKYLYTYSTGGIYYFDDISEELNRVDIGSALNIIELLRVVSNLKSARLIKNAIESVNNNELSLLKSISSLLFVSPDFEKEISEKIIYL